MASSVIWALVVLAAFIAILTIKKIPNWMTFPVLACIAYFSGITDANTVYGVLGSSSLHLMIIICMFSGLFATSGLDIALGGFVERLAGNKTGKSREMVILAILFAVTGAVSFVLQNSYVAIAFLPVMQSIAKKCRVSLSKMVLFIIFSTTLGGAVTLIGTPTNVYANTALESANLATFGMFDFTWVALPIFIIGGAYMVLMNRWCSGYEDYCDDLSIVIEQVTPEMKKKQIVIGISFGVFVLALALKSLKVISLDPNFIGYAMIALALLSGVVTFKDSMRSLDASLILFCAGINLMIKIMTSSGLGEYFGTVIINIVGDSKNMYVITAILCIGASVMTQFMNNMACAGVLAPVGITIAEALGANPQAIVLAIAIGAGCSYLTPMASGTNQTMLVFTKLKFQDFAKFGWPLLIISWICCIVILPLVFPFF